VLVRRVQAQAAGDGALEQVGVVEHGAEAGVEVGAGAGPEDQGGAVEQLAGAAAVGGQHRHAGGDALDGHLRQVVLPQHRHDAQVHARQHFGQLGVRVAVVERHAGEAVGHALDQGVGVRIDHLGGEDQGQAPRQPRRHLPQRVEVEVEPLVAPHVPQVGDAEGARVGPLAA
jgi:hypothetical protein